MKNNYTFLMIQEMVLSKTTSRYSTTEKSTLSGEGASDLGSNLKG